MVDRPRSISAFVPRIDILDFEHDKVTISLAASCEPAGWNYTSRRVTECHDADETTLERQVQPPSSSVGVRDSELITEGENNEKKVKVQRVSLKIAQHITRIANSLLVIPTMFTVATADRHHAG